MAEEQVLLLARAASSQTNADAALFELSQIFCVNENIQVRLLICDTLEALQPNLCQSNIPERIQRNFYAVLQSTDHMARALALRAATSLLPTLGFDNTLASCITDTLKGDTTRPEYKMAIKCLPYIFEYFEDGSASTQALILEILSAFIISQENNRSKYQ
ncbi:MAG: hypothetical protein EZS28_008408 [Streblomastix strix]|uniref:Clathrin/coatomer adaptor adaptin-like N-terminal domain-containing protein n=1 Tax=Streblomastix strix TaxID=222440 RepID=A0A5J4WLV8_9EUKA|nr:MAG: hypothetical protein EZS28_008408 [Streblomastix strix]